MQKMKPAIVIMAAGQGKRMKNPDMAKVLYPLAGLPLLDHVIELARTCDPARIIVIAGHQREAVIRHLQARHPDVETAAQERQLGTAHAVLQTAPLLKGFGGDVVILSGDAPLTRPSTLAAMLDTHRNSSSAVTVLTAVLPDPSGYGRVIRDSGGGISRIVEHRDATEAELAVREFYSGIYVFRAGPVFDALALVRNDNAQGEYYLPDVFGIFAERRLRMTPCIVESFDEIRGVNTIEQLREMEIIYAAMKEQQTC